MWEKETARIARHKGIRKKLIGTPERPRLAVHRSLKHLYVQLIDDLAGRTLFSFSSQDKNFGKQVTKGTKSEKSGKLGEFFAGQIKSKGIQRIAFDRAGYQYHGRIKALAESLRKAGLQF